MSDFKFRPANADLYNPDDSGAFNSQEQGALEITDTSEQESRAAIAKLVATTRDSLKDSSYCEKDQLYG